MISDLFVWIVNPILEFVTSFIPEGVACPVTVFPLVGSFIGSIYYTTADFIPWTEIFMMVSFLVVVAGIRIAMQVVHLIRG